MGDQTAAWIAGLWAEVADRHDTAAQAARAMQAALAARLYRTADAGEAQFLGEAIAQVEGHATQAADAAMLARARAAALAPSAAGT